MKKIDVTQPYAMTSPFADGVYSSVSTSDFEIPADTSTAPDDTCVIDDGFLPITSTDLDDGGIAPERKNFNGMFYLSTDQRFYLQNGGFITYNSNVATAIGGYPQDAVLGYIDGQGTYKLVRSLIDDNTNDFTQDETLIDGEHWEEIAMGGGGSGYQLFDIVMKDHVLSYEETLGLAPLGTYVYKEAIAGTRYGYPDFYQKMVDEYNDANNTIITENWTQPVLTANGTMGGSSFAVDSDITQYSGLDVFNAFNGITSGSDCFHSVSGATTGYIDMYNPEAINVTNIKIYNQNAANRASSAGNIYGSNNGTDWTLITAYTNLVQTAGGTWDISLSGNTAYYKYYRLESTAGGSDSYWTINEIELTANIAIGIQNSNKHKFYDISDKATFDNMYAITGEAWYYGIDTTNERIFLPRSTRFRNGTSSDVGEYNPAGLPNITGKVLVPQASDLPDGESLYADGAGLSWGTSGSTGQRIIHIDASRSSSIYGASNTVEYSSTKLIPYMCVGNQSDWAGMTDVVNQGMTILAQVNAGLATKVDIDGSNATFPHIIDTYVNGESWYRIWSDGWCEQGGVIGNNSYATDITIALMKTFTDSNYSVQMTCGSKGGTVDTGHLVNYVRGIEPNQFKFNVIDVNGSTQTGNICWRASGFLAQGEF